MLADERSVFVADKWDDFEEVLPEKKEVRKTCVVAEVGERIFESGRRNEMGTSHKSEVVPLVSTKFSKALLRSSVSTAYLALRRRMRA